ncbi:MAG: sigma 54-interacting transcriptional regulator [Candidatus Sumerlaeaceae bacterium]|jgi:transcriptional regulator with GAF, ATPase, and Fis domain
MPKFVVTSGPQAGREIEMVGERLLFGRTDDCDVVIADPNVSRTHAQALNVDGMIILYDLNSSNGTFVNNVPISRAFLMDGDEVRIGNTTFQFVSTPSTSSNVDATLSPSLTISAMEPSANEALDQNTRILRFPSDGVENSILKDTYLKLKTLYRIFLEISQSETLKCAAEAVGRAALLALGFERMIMFLRSEGSSGWSCFHIQLSTTAKAKEACLPQIPTHILDSVAVQAEPSFSRWDNQHLRISTAQNANILLIPIIRNKQPLGILVADNPVSGDLISKDDADFLSTLVLHLVVRLRQIEQVDHLRQENIEFRQRSGDDYAIVTQDDRMKRLMSITMRAAERDCPVLITGETGTGKELIARSLHNYSPRRTKPFVAVNCAALPETLLESELFGHEKGAFTGAVERRIGKFELADGGTLFLDEIGDMSASAQAKLLRVLQDGEIQRLGSNKVIKVNVRVVAATNKKLEDEVEKGNFRQDLYYRIRVLELVLPPLRERPSDIPVLAQYFLEQLRHRFPTSVKSIHPETIKCLLAYNYPGNVRELRNIIERALVLATGDVLLPEHLPAEVLNAASGNETRGAQEGATGPEPRTSAPTLSLAEVVREHILRVLDAVQGNRVKAAAILGISRTTLYEKLKEYGIEGKTRDEAGE